MKVVRGSLLLLVPTLGDTGGASSHLPLYCFVSPPTNAKIVGESVFIDNLGGNDRILQFQHTYTNSRIQPFPRYLCLSPSSSASDKTPEQFSAASIIRLFQVHLAYFGLDGFEITLVEYTSIYLREESVCILARVWNDPLRSVCWPAVKASFSTSSATKERPKAPLGNYCSSVWSSACCSFSCDQHSSAQHTGHPLRLGRTWAWTPGICRVPVSWEPQGQAVEERGSLSPLFFPMWTKVAV